MMAAAMLRCAGLKVAAVGNTEVPLIAALDTVAKARRLPHAQIALAWLLQKAAVAAPIVGATRMEHLEAAVGALGVQLSGEEVAALEAPYLPHPVAGFG
jgi:aryl-alcohol dehydrogenase-like predicted oxidoreductase